MYSEICLEMAIILCKMMIPSDSLVDMTGIMGRTGKVATEMKSTGLLATEGLWSNLLVAQ